MQMFINFLKRIKRRSFSRITKLFLEKIKDIKIVFKKTPVIGTLFKIDVFVHRRKIE